MEIERLNHLLMLIWAKIQQGDMRSIEQALGDGADLCLRGMDQAQKMSDAQAGGVLIVDGQDKDEYIASLEQ